MAKYKSYIVIGYSETGAVLDTSCYNVKHSQLKAIVKSYWLPRFAKVDYFYVDWRRSGTNCQICESEEE